MKEAAAQSASVPDSPAEQWLNCEAVGDQVAAVKSLQDSAARWTAVLPLDAALRSKFDATESGTTFGARNIALSHR